MERLPVVDDSVLNFIGELYVHEPEEFRKRVVFSDYLTVSLHGFPEGTERRGEFAETYHAHRCHCGTWVTCERPAMLEDVCAAEPVCRSHEPVAQGPPLLLEEA